MERMISIKNYLIDIMVIGNSYENTGIYKTGVFCCFNHQEPFIPTYFLISKKKKHKIIQSLYMLVKPVEK